MENRFGSRRLFLHGITLFTLASASLACGLSSSQGLLIVARAVQGLGGAVVSAVALSLIMAAFSLGISAKLVMRFGLRPPLAVGLLLAAAGLLLFARAQADGIFVIDVLPGMILIGAVFAAVAALLGALLLRPGRQIPAYEGEEAIASS